MTLELIIILGGKKRSQGERGRRWQRLFLDSSEARGTRCFHKIAVHPGTNRSKLVDQRFRRKFLSPLQKLAKRSAAMAVLRLLFRAELGKGLCYRRKIK